MRTDNWVKGLSAAAILIASVTLTACKRDQAETEEVATLGPELALAEQRTLDIKAEAAGLVEPITTVEIKSKASGEVTSVHVQSGQEVTRGTLMVEIEPRDVRNSFSQAEADLDVAKARSQTAEAQFNRVTELRKANVATEQELESSQLEQANAKAALVKAQVNLDLARERMNDVTIRAPLAGMVIERTVEPGTIISSASGSVSGGTVLLRMADLSLVQVRALVDQTDIGRVQPGQTARVSVEAYPSRIFDGTVVKIEPKAVVDQNVTMFPVLIQLPNEERLLKPGMNTNIEIEIARRPNAVVIPNDAVVNSRDILTTATALGLSEDDAQKKIDAMQPAPRFAGGPSSGAGPNEQPVVRPTSSQQPAATDGASADPNGRQGRDQAQGEGGRSGQGGDRSGRAGGTMTPECRDVLTKVRAAREGGPPVSEVDRNKSRACMSQMGRNAGQQIGIAQQPAGAGRGGRGGAAARPRGQNRPGVVFVPTATGPEPRNVMLGYSDLDYTEVVTGLKAGEQVYLVTAARLLQTQKLNEQRMRQRMQGPVPGMGQMPGGPGGPGGGGGGGRPGRGN
jgi:HlyD family secretion protein